MARALKLQKTSSKAARRTALIAAAMALTYAGGVAAQRVDYSYDGLGRLVESCHAADARKIVYRYDPAGNRTSVESGVACGTTVFSIADAAAVTEGGTLSFTVTRTGFTGASQTVNFASADGSATAAADYTATSGTLTFDVNETSKTVSVTTIDDTLYETAETVLVNLTAPSAGAQIGTGQGTGAINSNDGAPSFSISGSSAQEGSLVTFTVTKSGATGFDHGVDYATANGTAVAGTHYTATSGSLSFTANETSKTFTVQTTLGSVPTGSVAFTGNLSSATNGAAIATGQATGTITARPNNPPIAVNDSHYGTYQVPQTAYVNVIANDSDPDNDAIAVTAASCTSGGCSVTIAGGTLEVLGTSPGIKYLNYTITDARGLTASASVQVALFEDLCGGQFC